MQKVESYYNLIDAKTDMREHIRAGWRVHTCTMSSYVCGYNTHDNVLVVYEK